MPVTWAETHWAPKPGMKSLFSAELLTPSATPCYCSSAGCRCTFSKNYDGRWLCKTLSRTLPFFYPLMKRSCLSCRCDVRITCRMLWGSSKRCCIRDHTAYGGVRCNKSKSLFWPWHLKSNARSMLGRCFLRMPKKKHTEVLLDGRCLQHRKLGEDFLSVSYHIFKECFQIHCPFLVFFLTLHLIYLNCRKSFCRNRQLCFFLYRQTHGLSKSERTSFIIYLDHFIGWKATELYLVIASWIFKKQDCIFLEKHLVLKTSLLKCSLSSWLQLVPYF